MGSTNFQAVLRRAAERAEKMFSTPFWFTIAELIVVIAVLAVLATVAFISISGYVEDARDARAKTNVRSVYSAIVSESASTGNSPRFYVLHDPKYSLSWSTAVLLSGTSSVLLKWGDWNEPNTNYSAGNPNFQNLKLNSEKFKISRLENWLSNVSFAESPTDETLPLVGAADVATDTDVTGNSGSANYVQVVGVPPSGSAFVVGNYPANGTGAVSGLVKDPTSPDVSSAIVEGAKAWGAAACLATTYSGYAVPWLSDGQSGNATKAVANGVSNLPANCSDGVFSYGSASATCDRYYSANGNACEENSWNQGNWSSCSWETGNWSYGTWGSCSKTCWSWIQNRSASCVRWNNGTRSRSVTCVKYDGSALADADCQATKPVAAEACSEWTDAVCGASVTAQSCNTQACPSCWTSNGWAASSSAPSSWLCLSWSPSSVTTTVGSALPWSWTCTDTVWWSSVGCSKPKTLLYNTSQFNTSSPGDAPCSWFPSISSGSPYGCSCMTGANTTSSTCSANSYMTHGNNTASCIYTCNLRPVN